MRSPVAGAARERAQSRSSGRAAFTARDSALLEFLRATYDNRAVGFRLFLIVALVAATTTVVATDAGAFRFGSQLTPEVQPQPGQPCTQPPGGRCTWIMNEAVGRPDGGERAQRRGTIRRIRVIASDDGRFRLQIVRAHETASGYEGRLVRRGPIIRYEGQPDDFEPYEVESFRVNIPVRRGDRLAIRTRRAEILRCGSGGDNTLLFRPPLTLADGWRPNTDEHDCLLLIEAVVRRAS